MILTSPWQSTARPQNDRGYVALLGLVSLRTVLLLPTFIRFGFRIDRQLKRSRGLLGYRTAAEPLHLRFFHLSAWEDAEAIDNFVRTQAHLEALQELSGHLGDTTFRYWQISGSELPLQLKTELPRLQNRSSRNGKAEASATDRSGPV